MHKASIIKPSGCILALILTIHLFEATALGQNRAIDVHHSRLTIHLSKTGVFSPFAHDHEIDASIVEGAADLSSAPNVALRLDARRLRVLDHDASAGTRAQIQKTMGGPEVLDSEHFPRLRFSPPRSKVSEMTTGKYMGSLTLCGQKKPIIVDVTFKDEHYLGSATIRQRDFGITPVSIAGGTVRVKDEVRIDFDIVLA